MAASHYFLDNKEFTMYKCKYFAIHELVDPNTYEVRGGKAWQLLDSRMLKLIDALRDILGPATINNYYWGGDRERSGLRIPGGPHYRNYSQHTHGRAYDILFKNYSADEVRAMIEDRIDYLLAVSGLESITVEEGVNWLHVDGRNNEPGFNTVKP